MDKKIWFKMKLRLNMKSIKSQSCFLMGLIVIVLLQSSCGVLLEKSFVGIMTSIGKTQDRSMNDQEPNYSKNKEGKLNGLVAQLLFCVSNGDTSLFREEYNHYIQFKQLNNKSNFRKSYGIVLWESILKNKDTIGFQDLTEPDRFYVKGSNRYTEYSTDTTENSYDLFWDGSILNMKRPMEGERNISLFLNNPSTTYSQYEFRHDTVSFNWTIHHMGKVFYENFTFRILSCKEVNEKNWGLVQPTYCKEKSNEIRE